MANSGSIGDIEMDLDQPIIDINCAQSYRSSVTLNQALKLLVVDTNILIDHLHIVRQVHMILSELSGQKIQVLIPTTVINDGLKLSTVSAGTTPQGDITKGDLARAATRWLLAVHKVSQDGTTSTVRLQKWAERLDKSLDKGDDRIIDCCLYFNSTAATSLWTNDQNLALLAGSNDIPVIGHASITMENIIRFLGINIPATVVDNVRETIPTTEILPRSVGTEIDTMDLDEFQLEPVDAVHTTKTESITSSIYYPFHSDPFRIPLTPSPPGSPAATSVAISQSTQPRHAALTIPAHLVYRLTTILRPALYRLRPETTPLDSDHLRQLTTLHSALLEYQDTLPRSSASGIALFRSIDALRIITAFFRQHETSGRVRTGAVAESLEVLGEMFFELQLVDAREELVGLAGEIREL